MIFGLIIVRLDVRRLKKESKQFVFRVFFKILQLVNGYIDSKNIGNIF